MEHERVKESRATLTMPTKFDLPIEYHVDSLTGKFMQDGMDDKSKDNLRFSTASDRSLFSRRSRFEQLDTSFLIAQLSMRPVHAGVRELALDLLHNDILKKLAIIQENNESQTEPLTNGALPHNMFSWLREDFYKRRQQQDVLWIKLLEKDTSECLDALKFKIDMQNLANFLRLIFAGLMNTDADLDIEVHVLRYILDALDFVGIFEKLTQELASNKIVFHDKLNVLLGVKFRKRDSRTVSAKSIMEQKLMTANVMDPIEMRYQTAYYNNKANQQQFKMDALEDQFQREIQMYDAEVRKENARSQHALHMYFAEIEKYKTQINIMSNKYDRDFDDIDNKLGYTKISIDKLKEQRIFFDEQLERFKEELEAARLKTIADEEKAEAARRAEEALAAAELLKKKKKKKGGKKQKK